MTTERAESSLNMEQVNPGEMDGGSPGMTGSTTDASTSDHFAKTRPGVASSRARTPPAASSKAMRDPTCASRPSQQ
jgi:hypothetical protein